MSELFTQNYSDKPLFHTDTDISESLHNQVDEASNGEELLDNTEKQAESLLSNDDYVSETKDVISDDSEDVAESLSPPADGNRKYITGTNTPRASRSNAYYELLRDQQTNGHRSPAMRGTTAAAHGITSAGGLVSYQEDFATDAAQDLGVHGAAAELIMQETFLGTAAEDVGILGSYAVKGIKDVRDGTRIAEEVLHTGGDVLRMELGSSAVQIGSAGARTALHYAETFSTSADDFADRTPGIISNTGFQTGHSVIRVARFFAHPVKAMASIGRTALICGVIILLLLIIGLLGQMSGTTTTSALCADRPEDIQQLVESINTYRNEAATDELRRAFRNDVDPNGNPYGYDTLTGQRSNNMQHGVTWSYANGIYNDTAEIISMAAVYYQQDWPSSQELAAFTDDVPFTQYCRALTAYGMEITARESAPYSCISYGGCVNGYRSEGETVTITEHRCETHTCAQGNEECGHYRNVEWASLLYRMDWEALYGVADGIKCRSVGSALTADELQALLAGLNIDPDTARGQVVAFAISCQGHFVYGSSAYHTALYCTYRKPGHSRSDPPWPAGAGKTPAFLHSIGLQFQDALDEAPQCLTRKRPRYFQA